MKQAAELLASNGYIYPLFKLNDYVLSNHSIPFFSLFTTSPESYHVNISEGYTSLEKIQCLHKEYKKQLDDQLKAFHGDKMVISGEDISVLDVNGIENLRRYLLEATDQSVEIKIILFCRNPITYARSHIQQSIKGGATLEDQIDNYALFSKTHYTTRVDNFLKVFPRESIQVVKYEDSLLHRNGPLGAFLDIIGLDQQTANLCKSQRFNESASYEAVVLMSAINRNVPKFENNLLNSGREGYKQDLIQKIPGAKFTLPPDFNQRIWEASRDDAHWLCELFSLPEYEFETESLVERDELWSMDALAGIYNIYYRQPELVREIILSEIRAELERNKDFFSAEKKRLLEKFVLNLSTRLPANSRFHKLAFHCKAFGIVAALKIYLNYIFNRCRR
ncbi:MAG: hypothetical protein RLZZ214_1490 [Verrucomicrobiota bacterium]|jgi:hypothetical protein